MTGPSASAQPLDGPLDQPLDGPLGDVDVLARIWIPVGLPGFSGDDKQRRADLLDERCGPDGWRYRFVVRGELVDFDTAIAEYEEAYRVHLRRNPAIVDWLVTHCANVYDHSVDNVHDDDYVQPGPAANHYQDISVRRVVAELADEQRATQVVDARSEMAWGEATEAIDLGTGERHLVPRARGFRGRYLAQIRDAESPAYFLNPAVVPVHDPALITTLPGRHEWYHLEGCAHLSVEAYWQMAKVIEVRYDRFLALGDLRHDPLADV
ncbi:MAG: hypothetical protein ACE37B_07735 [Ilumatobacter sp.]|jgi:hypothetical protein|uniref:hypothetical protein n=1 Tax=Ilumatobacter sp. TaxID=1967498 RepID=UPI00391DF264